MELLTLALENWQTIALVIVSIVNPTAQIPALLGKPKLIQQLKLGNTLVDLATGNHGKEKSIGQFMKEASK